MSIKIQVTERKFFAELANGQTFSLNQSDYGSHLKGSVMEKIKVVLTFQVSWYTESTQTEFIHENLSSVGTIRCTNSDFIKDGFSAGDYIVLSREDSAEIVIGDISYVDKNEMFLINIPSNPTAFNTTSKTLIRGRTPNTAIKYKYNLIENNDSFALDDVLTGQERGFIAKNIGLSQEEIQHLGNNKASHFGSFQISNGTSINDNLTPATNFDTVQVFYVEHTFLISPYFQEGEIENLLNNVIPERLASENTLKYVLEAEFRTQYNNPNTSKTIQFEGNLGSVAWFNESFNGFESQYSIENISKVIQSTNLPTEQVTKGETTILEFDVKSSKGSFALNTPLVLYHSILPDWENYQYSITKTFQEIWLYESLRGTSLTVPTSINGQYFKNTEYTYINSTTIHVKTEITYDANANSVINADLYYLIGIGIGNPALNVNQTDKVVLNVETNTYDVNADIPDLFETTKFEIYSHPKNFDETSEGFNNYKGWIEDGIMVDFECLVNLNKQAIIEVLSVQLVAYHKTKNTYFVIQKVPFDLSNQVFSNNAQQIEIDTKRKFSLATNDQFNFVKLTTTNQTAGKQAYQGQVGLKIDWQSWLKLIDADKQFYDLSKPLNNLNRKASNYINDDYELRLMLLGDISQNGISTEYGHFSQALEIYDYEEDGNDPNKWECQIETFKIDGITSLEGTVLVDEPTIIKCTFISVGHIPAVEDYYGIVRIEEQNQNGYDIDELSSIRLYPKDNRLMPLEGENLLKIEQVGNNLVLTCQTNPSEIQDTPYKISAKIATIEGASQQPRAYSNDYSTDYA